MSDSNVIPLPRRPLPEDPMEALKELVAEYDGASNRERNYGSNRFAACFGPTSPNSCPSLSRDTRTT